MRPKAVLLNRLHFNLAVFFLAFDTLKEQKYSISKWSHDKGWSGNFLFFSKEPSRKLFVRTGPATRSRAGIR